MDEMNVSSAKYYKFEGASENLGIIATVDGTETYVPIAEGNTTYKEIMRQVDEGTLTIADAD